jgi:short-subunit dehydrogenase
MTPQRRAALITGASARYRSRFARHLAARDYDLLLVARRAERLEEPAAELRQARGVRCEVFGADLTNPAAPAVGREVPLRAISPTNATDEAP